VKNCLTISVAAEGDSIDVAPASAVMATYGNIKTVSLQDRCDSPGIFRTTVCRQFAWRLIQHLAEILLEAALESWLFLFLPSLELSSSRP
jgi:hypothetical protein